MGCIINNHLRWWPDGRIPYVIDSGDFPAGSANRSTVAAAISEWNTTTLLQLVPRDIQNDYVEFIQADDSCSSAIGRQGGRQTVGCDIGDGWGKWSVVHEIGHALGMFHEQTRLDRDDWVTVHWGNIEAGKEHNFEVDTTNRRDICRYDYDSLMHYGEFAFAVDSSNKTLSQDHSGPPIGQRDHLSAIDKRVVDFLHGTYSLKNELQEDGLNPAAGARQVLPNGGSLREWIVCRMKVFVAGGGGF